jgi:hypothetical protein
LDENKIVNKDNSLAVLDGGDLGDVLSVTETTALKKHERLLVLKRQAETLYIEMAECLYWMNNNRAYRFIDGGYESFGDYVEKSLMFQERKARYLVDLWWWFGVKLEANPRLIERIQMIGWSKAKFLVQIVDSENADEWFQIASNLTKNELQKITSTIRKEEGIYHLGRVKTDVEQVENVKRFTDGKSTLFQNKNNEAKNKPKEDQQQIEDILNSPPENTNSTKEKEERVKEKAKGVKPPKDLNVKLQQVMESSAQWKNVVFQINTDWSEDIDEAIKIALEKGRTRHRGLALAHVCLHFRSCFTHDWNEYIGEWLEKIEEVTGLKIIAIDPKQGENGEVVYGGEIINDYEEKQS